MFEINISLVHRVLLEQVTREVTSGNIVISLILKSYSKNRRELKDGTL
jgi:hypothetical protein